VRPDDEAFKEKTAMAMSAITISSDPGSWRFTFDALGTHWEVATREPLSPALQTCILERIDAFDVTYSRFRADSLVSRIAAAASGGRFAFPEDSIPLFDLYDRLHEATAGAVDPLIGRTLELLGYDASYSLTPAPKSARDGETSARPSWARDVVRTGITLVTSRPLVIDVGAAGKGYVVELVSEMLQEVGLTEFVVDGSGDLRHSGPSAIHVGLEHPFDPALVIGVSNLQNRALCSSAVNRRAWGTGLHHVVDSRTGAPVQEVVATWVVAADAATADGLATALFFTGAEQLAETFSFACVRMLADGRAEISHSFDGELFSASQAAAPRARKSRVDTRRHRAHAPSARRKIGAAAAAVVAAGVIAGCSSASTDAAPASTASTSEARPRAASANRSRYRDGVYGARGQYGSLPSSITVRVRLRDGVITFVRVTPHATNPTSLALQRRFAAAVPAVVVGRAIDTVRVGRLAGSSGTPDGFNAALEQIKQKARKAR
jgi:thiamine biosynthesis lipoprotein